MVSLLPVPRSRDKIVADFGCLLVVESDAVRLFLKFLSLSALPDRVLRDV